MRALIMSSVISFDSERCQEVHRVRSLTNALPHVHGTVTRRVSRTYVVPHKVGVPRRRVQFPVVMVLWLHCKVRAFVPWSLVT